MTEKDELALFVFGKIVDFLRSEGCVVRNPEGSSSPSGWKASRAKKPSKSIE